MGIFMFIFMTMKPICLLNYYNVFDILHINVIFINVFFIFIIVHFIIA